jgi:Fe-S cluster biosynthesis and repair protein YggX
MTRMVKCVKLDKESEGLAQAPYPGELGETGHSALHTESKESMAGT